MKVLLSKRYFVLLISLIMSSYSVAACNEASHIMKKVPEMKAEQWQKGTVHYFDIEGGFYGLIANNGDKLLAINLDKTLRQHGTTITFQGQTVSGMNTIQQWGVPYKITAFKLLKKGNNALLQPDR